MIAHGRRPVVYIRRSKVDASNPGTVSQETQTSQATALVAVHEPGSTPVILEDWGRSGRGSKVHLRPDYARLLAMVEADQVSAVYSYNLSRLGRNVDEIRRLVRLASDHGTEVRTVDMGEVGRGATGTMLLTILSAVDEWQAEVQAERTAAGLHAWRELHPDEKLGRKEYGDQPGEDPAVVVDAFRRAGSYQAAAKLLTAEGVPNRVAGKGWNATTIRRIVMRTAPDAIPLGQKKGRSANARYRLQGLLTCHCGATLTCRTTAWGVGYVCPVGWQRDSAHSKPYQVAESKLMPWVRSELSEAAAKLRRTVADPEADAKLAAIEVKRRRVDELYVENGDKAARTAALAKLQAEADALMVGQRSHTWIDQPSKMSEDNAADYNAGLRNLWSAIRLGEDMLPVLAEWRPGAWA